MQSSISTITEKNK